VQQVFGGHGYIEEWGMEQFVRDARIAQIYEGTNGIQAMDLVGRKLAQNGGRAVQAFFALVDAECAAAKAKPELAALAGQVEGANAELKAATMWLMQNGMMNPNNAGAGASLYAHHGDRQPWADVAADGRSGAGEAGQRWSRRQGVLRGQAGDCALFWRTIYARRNVATDQADSRVRGDDGASG
jgi:hypothetical protein